MQDNEGANSLYPFDDDDEEDTKEDEAAQGYTRMQDPIEGYID